ncbi:MAG: gamma-glutamyl-gamma-aminobutyrate hydrolase family protein [Desulfobacterales bacterium]
MTRPLKNPAAISELPRWKNKIVQAIEHEKHPFMIGVQWHPEYLPQIKTQQRLFQSLTDAARKTRQ